MLRLLPGTFYSYATYAVQEGLSSLVPSGFTRESPMPFLAGTGSQFGNVAPVKVELQTPTVIVTNVQPFPWNQIIVNGRRKKSSELLARTFDWTAPGTALVLAVPLEAGEYTIEYRFRPAKAWSVLEGISFGILVIWFIIWIIAALGVRDRDTKIQ
jgi:hypothetical protein